MSAPSRKRDGKTGTSQTPNAPVKCSKCQTVIQPSKPYGLWGLRCPNCETAVGGGGGN